MPLLTRRRGRWPDRRRMDAAQLRRRDPRHACAGRLAFHVERQLRRAQPGVCYRSPPAGLGLLTRCESHHLEDRYAARIAYVLFFLLQELLARYRMPSRPGHRQVHILGEWDARSFHRHPGDLGVGYLATAWRPFDITLERYRDWDVGERLRSTLPDPSGSPQVAVRAPRRPASGYVGPPLVSDLPAPRRFWISPATNLVTNIGFDDRATHTANAFDLRRHIPRAHYGSPRPPGPPAAAAVDDRYDRWAFLLEMMKQL